MASENIGVPFTPTIVHGFVEKIERFEDEERRYLKVSGEERWLWIDHRGASVKVNDEVKIESDDGQIIGVWVRLV